MKSQNTLYINLLVYALYILNVKNAIRVKRPVIIIFIIQKNVYMIHVIFKKTVLSYNK